MYPSIRTTIFWNIFLLLLAAVFLIGFAVLRITGQEIMKQRISAGEDIFFSISTAITQLVNTNPSLLHSPSLASELQRLITVLGTNKGIIHICVADREKRIVATSEEHTIGQRVADTEIPLAFKMKELIKKTRAAANSGRQLIIWGSIPHKEMTPIAVLKVVFSLADTDRQIAQARKLLITYIVFDAAILLFFGTWLLSRYLVKPLHKITRLTEQIAQGELDPAGFLNNRNEIGQLSASLCRMAERLNEEKHKVLQQVRSLEEKNRQIQQAQQEIIQSEKLASVGRLAAGIAHEIGNPIGIILGYIQLLLTHQLNAEEKQDCLQRMNAETERINGIIKNLLDFAQPSAGHIEELNLNSIIQETHALVSFQKKFQHITTTFECDPALPPLVADQKQIRQILINLTLNALDAMPQGGTLIYKTAVEKIADREYIALSLTDSGTGISSDIMGKIFDPFFTTKQPGKGTGLGLSNVQRIVNSLGGTIKVFSEPGKGTRFTILFPCACR